MPRHRNVPEGGYPEGAVRNATLAPGRVFSLNTCNYEDLPDEEQGLAAELIAHAEGAGQLVLSGNPELDNAVMQGLWIKDEGPTEVPWARFPSSYNLDDWVEAAVRAETEEEGEQLRIAANKRQVVKRPAEPFRLLAKAARAEGRKATITPEALELFPDNILGDNAKLKKGAREAYYARGLMLAPYTTAGVGNLCPFATKSCAAACLNVSGQAEGWHFRGLKGKYDQVGEARKRKTVLWYADKAAFLNLVNQGILYDLNTTRNKRSMAYGMQLTVRLNVLSDLPWEALVLPTGPGGEVESGNRSLMLNWANEFFYDYTKNPERMKRFLERNNWPANYHLTFSFSENNAKFAFWALQHGAGVSVVFDTPPKTKLAQTELPKVWCGYPVIDADKTDVRFADRTLFKLPDGQGYICGLRLKGRETRKRYDAARKEERDGGLPHGAISGGFIQSAEDAGATPDGMGYEASRDKTSNAAYIANLIKVGESNRVEQRREGFLTISSKTLQELGWAEDPADHKPL